MDLRAPFPVFERVGLDARHSHYSTRDLEVEAEGRAREHGVNKELKLIDFGIAKRIESNDTTNIVRDNAIGTLNYMAPEAFVGNQGSRKNNESLKLGRQSDIWSLGCILYQMVCLCSRVCVGVCR